MCAVAEGTAYLQKASIAARPVDARTDQPASRSGVDASPGAYRQGARLRADGTQIAGRRLLAWPAGPPGGSGQPRPNAGASAHFQPASECCSVDRPASHDFREHMGNNRTAS